MLLIIANVLRTCTQIIEVICEYVIPIRINSPLNFRFHQIEDHLDFYKGEPASWSEYTFYFLSSISVANEPRNSKGRVFKIFTSSILFIELLGVFWIYFCRHIVDVIAMHVLSICIIAL